MNLSHCASVKNPPKGYGSIEAGMKVIAYRNQRLDFWRKKLNARGYTEEVRESAERDVVSEFGNPF